MRKVVKIKLRRTNVDLEEYEPSKLVSQKKDQMNKDYANIG